MRKLKYQWGINLATIRREIFGTKYRRLLRNIFFWQIGGMNCSQRFRKQQLFPITKCQNRGIFIIFLMIWDILPGDMKLLTQKRTRCCSAKKSGNNKQTGWRRYLLMRDYLSLSPFNIRVGLKSSRLTTKYSRHLSRPNFFKLKEIFKAKQKTVQDNDKRIFSINLQHVFFTLSTSNTERLLFPSSVTQSSSFLDN